MTGRLQGRVAIVTGAASGIGAACAALFAREGARVMASDLQAEAGRALAERLSAEGGDVQFAAHDVSREEDWGRIVRAVSDRFGRLDVLVNNAGIALTGPVTDMPLETWRRLMAVNLDGVFLGVKHALPLMRRGGGGSIVNMSSVAGLKGVAGQAGYSATKGAVRLFTKSVALECAQAGDGVRVNSVHPGLIDTPIYGAGRSRLDEMSERLVPLGVKGAPEDVAEGVLWLASDESRYVTGAELVIDGGFTVR